MKKPSTSKKKISKVSFKTPIWKRKSTLMMVGFVVLFGGIGVYKVTSSSALTEYVTGTNFVWYSSSAEKRTPAVYSYTGVVCFSTTFQNFNPIYQLNKSYYGKLYLENFGGSLTYLATSAKFQANGNRDHQCFNFTPNRTYVIGFKPAGTISMDGYWAVAGYRY